MYIYIPKKNDNTRKQENLGLYSNGIIKFKRMKLLR